MSRLQRMLRAARGMMMRHLPGMLTCLEFERFILDYEEGRLGDAQRRVFEWHLRLCPDCRRYIEAYRQTVELTGRAFRTADAPLPEEVPEDLIKAILLARDAGR